MLHIDAGKAFFNIFCGLRMRAHVSLIGAIVFGMEAREVEHVHSNESTVYDGVMRVG